MNEETVMDELAEAVLKGESIERIMYLETILDKIRDVDKMWDMYQKEVKHERPN